MAFYRKGSNTFFDPSSLAALTEVVRTGDFTNYRALSIDDSAKLRDFPERGDFTKVAENFVQCSVAHDFKLPSYPDDFHREFTTLEVHYVYDKDGRKGVPWKANMEYHFFRPSGRLVYQINIRLPNDGFLYLSPDSAVGCPIAEDVKAGTAVRDGDAKLLHDAIPGWMELSPHLIGTGKSLVPIQHVFINWLKANRLPKQRIRTNVFYNASYRRLDIRLTYPVNDNTKIEWQIFFEPGAPDVEYVEHVIDGDW
jgi:hypothetical protein